jgi:tripartite-type tricarboxylate transporter receptor subunit TctC
MLLRSDLRVPMPFHTSCPRPIGLIAALSAALCLAGPAVAQDFPTHTVRIIVPFPAGGSLDLVARLIGDRLAEEWSYPVVIENRSGVNGALGAEAVAKSAPDGHTLLFATSPVLTTNKLLYHDLAYDPATDFKPVSLAAIAPNVLGVSPGLPFRDVQGLISYAKANPGLLTYASQGNGSTGHLTGAMFNLIAGTDIRHVPYRGAAPAWSDVLAGHVSLRWDGSPSVLGQIRGGAVRALAVGGLRR